MKPETKKWLEAEGRPGRYQYHEVRDVLDTIAKLRAENRDLKARLKTLAFWSALTRSWEGLEEWDAALDIKNKTWRKR